MPNKFVKGLDRLMWVPTQSNMNNAHAAGVSWCSDKRSDISRNPFIYQLVGNTVLNRWNVITKGMGTAANPGLGGTFGAGAGCEFAPSRALEGNIGVGSTTDKIVTTTAMTAVGVNMLANRGGSGDYGFKIRIIMKSSGKVAERMIVANTGGTTPTIWLDNPLPFAPVSGDTYELLSGQIFMLGAGAIAATSFRSLEVAANGLSSLSNTNLPTTITTDSELRVLDEQYTPEDVEPGTGLVTGGYAYDTNISTRYALSATAAGASSITGQISGGDASLLVNEYRNFQIRIVEDLGNPASVNQRKIIASHTAGAAGLTAPVYTLGSAWAVPPSATAKFVIENPNLLLLRTTATGTLYVYNYNKENITNGTNTINANAWSTTYFGTPSAVVGAGCMIAPSYGIRPDVGKNSRHSFLYFFRGANTATVDKLDIAGAINGTWYPAIVYDGNQVLFNTGAGGDYAPCDNEGRFFYINAYVASVNNQIYRFDVRNCVLSPHTPTSMAQSGTAAVGKRLATYAILKENIDPDTQYMTVEKYTALFMQMHTSLAAYELITQI